MKKYTIKDKSGAKKIIYAKDLSHALTLADSSLNDSTYELYLGNDFHPDDWAQIRNAIKRFGLYVGEYRKGMQTITVHGDRKNLEKLLTYFGHYKGYSKEYNNIKDSTKDEANLPTTIQALVNDEEAAIKAYEVAIKNLEGKIDETQMQVLINIMKDERRHVENLYAILNGKVTEKNLEDSIKDATLEITVKNQSEYREIDSIAKKLHLGFYETAGNKAILEGSRKDLEEYIDLVWGGDASIKRQIRG